MPCLTNTGMEVLIFKTTPKNFNKNFNKIQRMTKRAIMVRANILCEHMFFWAAFSLSYSAESLIFGGL